MLNSGRIVRPYAHAVNQMLQVQRGKGCLLIYGLVASLKEATKWRRGKSMWLMRGFEFRPPSLSLSLLLSLSLSLCVSVCLSLSELGVLVCRCRLPSFDLAPLSRNLHLIEFLSSIRSNCFFFLFCFYREGHGLAEKLLLVIFIFWQISSTFRYALILCAEAPFSILKKVSAPITFGKCSLGR